MISDTPTVDRQRFETETGWHLRPEGACRGEVCIPLAEPPGDTVDLESVADQMGLPLVHDVGHGLWALGPHSVGGHTLIGAEAPELRLPQLDGDELALSSLRGQKVLLVAWAPY